MSIFDLLKHDADLHNKLSNKQKTTNGINETIGNTNGNINTTNVFNQVEKITVTNVFVLNNSSSTDGKQEAFANSDIDCFFSKATIRSIKEVSIPSPVGL